MKYSLRKIRLATNPVQEFLQTESASGVLLGIVTVFALVIANSPLSGAYVTLLQTKVVAGIGGLIIDKPLLLWINDGLMAIFFLVVGLEIKREIKYGQLSSFRSALLPMVGAFSGALIPALIYVAFNAGTPEARGWAIPMATDIAFALGLLALLGTRVPPWAKLLLLALAVVDDLIAVVVIALFYTETIKTDALIVAAVAVALLLILNMIDVRRLWPYLSVGLVLWVAVLKSGVHATIAGVILGFVIPAIARRQSVLTPREKELLREVGPAGTAEFSRESREERQQHLEQLEDLVVEQGSPLHRLEHKLHPLVAFMIIPVFAFANAGVPIDLSTLGAALTSRMTIGIIAGLFIGKQIGIFLSSWLLVKSGMTTLPDNRNTMVWLYGLSLLAGIGFTMSLFIGGLAFGEGAVYEQAKIGILAGSFLSGIVGFLLLRTRKPFIGE